MKLNLSKQHKNILGKLRCFLTNQQEEGLKTYLKNMDATFYELAIIDLSVLVMRTVQDIVFPTNSIEKQKW